MNRDDRNADPRATRAQAASIGETCEERKIEGWRVLVRRAHDPRGNRPFTAELQVGRFPEERASVDARTVEELEALVDQALPLFLRTVRMRHRRE
jgi:hypothetical protein